MLPAWKQGKLKDMKRRSFVNLRRVFAVWGLSLLIWAGRPGWGQPTVSAVSAFDSYSKAVEARLAQQHGSQDHFLASGDKDREGEESRLRRGEFIVEQLTPSVGAEFSGALLHHWRGTAFAPEAKAADFERLMRDFNSYPQHFSPQVIRAKVISDGGDRMEASMRVRQRHVITVVMDTAYDIHFGRLDARHGYSISRSTRIEEIDSPGTNAERTLNANEEHGFLWRLNTYWSYEERDGGLYLQIEAVSLTRSIPHGLGWAVRPYV
ncbi:MAG: hypothetical protein JWQ49_6432, partial [Edaphobacter sp.]|nr:hypothetical protein [Edaphobacter sp.]